MDTLTILMETTNDEILKSKIDGIRLEIEHLQLENEKLRLQNENIILRYQSLDSVKDKMDNKNHVTFDTTEYKIDEDTETESLVESEQEVLVTDDDILVLDKYNIKGSKLTNCVLNHHTITNDKILNYTGMLKHIWNMMDKQTIYDHTRFNMKDYYCNKNGYKWIYDIQLSVQLGNTKEILKEIITMCKVMKYQLKLTIELCTDNNLEVEVNKNADGLFEASIVLLATSTTTYDKYLYKNRFM